MPKVPYKAEPTKEDDDDYEIVSFEDFCDKSPSTKTDLLTLNDNINYRVHYEGDKDFKYAEEGEPSSKNVGTHTETSLNGPKNATYKRKLSFAPFGRTDKISHGSLFSGVIPKPNGESSREHRYERFSPRRGWFSGVWEKIVYTFPGILAIMLLCALCVAAWWAAAGALGGGWGDDHYRKLWERVHPEEVKKLEVVDKTPPTEYRYHDHNNLSTKNKSNATDITRKKDTKKNIYTERPAEIVKELCAHITNDSMRFDCYPQNGANENGCIERGCCWNASATPGAPMCFYPPQYDSYRFDNSTENKHGLTVYYARLRDTKYPGQFNSVRVDFYYLSEDMLQIKISDADNRRFEPPYPEIPTVAGPLVHMQYRVVADSARVGYRVVRTADNVTIVDTTVGGWILSDKFLQHSSLLPTPHVYGLGEKRSRLHNDMNWNTFTLFNSDQPPENNRPLYGSHPFYLALEKNGNSHGMLLLNSNAMDIVLQPTPAITYRTLGGVLDYYIFLGPSPQAVVSQYTSLIGRPVMPPYWSLGFHLCKYNYGSLNATKEVWQRNRDAGIPFDVQWNDLDYMSTANDFTYDKEKFAGLPQFVDQLHKYGMKYVILFDPGVSAAEKPGTYPPYDRGLELNVFIKNSTDQPFIGKVWNPVSTVYPDFTHPNASVYWREMFADFHQKLKFDGAWIDMNEPSNFLSGPINGSCAPLNLPYTPKNLYPESLNHKTVCADASHAAGAHYDVHNLYGLTEAVHTHNALSEIRGKRPFVISRASFPGLGRYAGHWSGDIDSSWDDMRMSIPDILTFSLFGVSMMGADICGFRNDATPELCRRWMQLGAFYPFSRNHNSDSSKPQDPAYFGGAVAAASARALRLRYKLLPYYYTLFWRAHLFGETVARPLFLEFPHCDKVHEIDTQFLIGPYIMISPILEQGKNTTKSFYPCGRPWYNVNTGQQISSGGTWLEISDKDMVAVREGAILPLQTARGPAPVNTERVRSGPLQLLAAAGVTVAGDTAATGELYWDDGDSINSYEEKKYSHIEFEVVDNELRSTVKWWGYGVPSIDTITVLGLPKVKSVTVNGEAANFTYGAKTQILCNACGAKGCDRHDPDMAAEPWNGLQIHKQLDQAIEDFYNTILEQFINTWYSKITLQPFFVDELRHQLRYASASLVRRALKINYARLIIDRLVPCALRHVTLSAECVRPVHVAASNRDAELRYLRCLTETVLPYLLRNSEVHNPIFKVLVREIFSGWVLLPLTDILADPYILNTLTILATSDEKMAPLPATPNYEVEFLENFIRQTDSVYSQRPRLLRIDLELLISSQDYFYTFMQHLKTTNNIYLLQFYKDIKSFQSQILNPDLSESEQKSLHAEAKRLYKHYLSTDVPRVNLPPSLLQELQELLDGGPECVKRLQTSRALYQAARQSHSALEKFMLPKFLHSEEFYKLFIGPRIPTGYQKQMTKRPHDKNISKVSSRVRSTRKDLDGQVLETDEPDIDVDILKYLDSLASDDVGGQDLSSFKVVLTNVECRMQAPPRRGTVRVFTLGVHRVCPHPQLWACERSEHDFHLLRSKLLEFHGDGLMADLPLPSRRDNSPLETLRYKYEDFIQRLLKISLLQTSELVYSFLTVDGDFSLAVQATTLATGPDLGNIYQSVAHKLRKEKGQHLESFLRNLLVSSDKERYQALKQGTVRDVEEAQEVNEDEFIHQSKREKHARNIHNTIYQNNFDIDPVVMDIDRDYQTTVVGFTQCVMFMLVKLAKAPAFITGVIGTLLSITRLLVDEVFNMLLNNTLRDLLNERRLAHLIRLGHSLLFGKKSTPRSDAESQRQRALQHLTALPAATRVFGLQAAVVTTHEHLQNPTLNKQLVYNLLDLCVLELFPELANNASRGRR
ncbi:uncharacterized protein LOC121739381 [Aricia agestis]|uniref:uncharacterized protein LOC121739381 n=1 Tax=Aricia agestis TaxID=91739 RepID=UPI001C201EC3|nr:uncharacterized protein LOC121739381 [Aricia agestis]